MPGSLPGDQAAAGCRVARPLRRAGLATGATSYFGKIGKHTLKWESHNEFVSYTIFEDGVADRPFDTRTFAVFPEDWLARAPGTRMTSSLIRAERYPRGCRWWRSATMPST